MVFNGRVLEDFKGPRWVVVGRLGSQFGVLMSGFELVKGTCGFSPRWVVVGRLGLQFGVSMSGFELVKGTCGFSHGESEDIQGVNWIR